MYFSTNDKCGVLGLRLFEPRLISGARHYRTILLPSLGPRRHYILTSGMARYRYLDCFICCNTVRLHFVNKLLYISLSSLTVPSSWQYEDENATKLVSEISFFLKKKEKAIPLRCCFCLFCSGGRRSWHTFCYCVGDVNSGGVACVKQV